MAETTKLKGVDFKSIFTKPLKVGGEKWYLLSVDWVTKLKNYLEGENNLIVQNPGKIDNSSLFEDGNCQILKQNLIENRDFKIVAREDCDKLVDCYGIIDNTHIIGREVVDLNLNKSGHKPNLILDIYPTNWTMQKYSSSDHSFQKSYSKADKIGKIYEDMRKHYKEPTDLKIRLWATNDTEDIKSFVPLANLNQTLYDAGLNYKKYIFMESADKVIPKWNLTSKHPLAKEHNALFLEYEQEQESNNANNKLSSQEDSYSTLSSLDGKNITAGLTGLMNLGNTCFMNSAIQCLSNVPPLTEYFLSKNYVKDINSNNPLGMKGLIAQSYARLMESLWTGRNSSTNLRSFKEVVGEFAPTFSGYQQHDSQELLTFLLDGLHEDLNRVKKKPYIEIKEMDGKKDEEMSAEAWKLYKMRNDSIVVDTFYGQLKSTLVCPTCHKISVTFDPFSTLSVPLPFKKERNLKVRIHFHSPDKKPLQCRVNVPKNGAIADLCIAASNLTDIPTNQLIVVKVNLNRFQKIYNSNESISFISPSDEIMLYEIPISPSDKGFICVPVYQQIASNPAPSNDNSLHFTPANFFVPPAIIALPADRTNESTVRQALMQKMRGYVTAPKPGDRWWEAVENGNGDQNKECGKLLLAEHHDSTTSTTTTDVGQSGVYLPHDATRETPPMFSIDIGNIFGNTKATLVEDPSAIQTPPGADLSFVTKVEPGTFLVLSWDPVAKSKFFDLEAAFDVEVHDSVCNSTGKIQGRKCCELTECLEAFVSTERLSEEDSWYCPGCKKHQQATKKFDLWKLPPILVIHLKRFFYTRFFREKITIGVNFPVNNLDLSKYVKDPATKPKATYNLIAVSNHYGEMGYGHYTAFAKNYLTKDWYNFDDSHVMKVKDTDVVSSAAYVLFYQRKGTEKLVTSALSNLTPPFSFVTNAPNTIARSTRSQSAAAAAANSSPPPPLLEENEQNDLMDST